jgi:hypothetical protein
MAEKLPDRMTIGEIGDRACAITEQADAEVYLEQLVERATRLYGQTREEATSIIKENLGYYAGYYNNETRARVERLFKCAHPVFGAISKGAPTMEEAFAAGQVLAKG